MTNANYYLGVETINDAANAIDSLSFMKVLDKATLQVRITNDDRIKLSVGPAAKNDDLSKGLMIYLGGMFTDAEINEIKSLSRLANGRVTNMVAEFVARQAVSLQKQGSFATHIILGHDSGENVSKKWWEFWR